MEKPEAALPVTSVFETGGKIREWMDTGLDNHERLEIFFSLLNTMTNLEVRYFHTILHSFMGRDWQSVVEAQELIRRTNDVFSMRESYDSMEPLSLLTNEMTRNQVLLDFSVLHTLSTSCGEIICDFLEKADIPGHLGRLEDGQVLSDLLMIINMGYRHPALRFHRRLRLGQLAVELVNRRTAIRTPSVSKKRQFPKWRTFPVLLANSLRYLGKRNSSSSQVAHGTTVKGHCKSNTVRHFNNRIG
ncbi:hypothetical protein RvY_15523-2 [Ramazzottius varieornatus]|uniref:SMAUG/ZCCHC2-like PHAT domain-containing protein n=1 Tax=Ramazzottius varieornatus TaxID=947166 RepID=A0A1D1VWF4_RAMVA|nr:hypothetical protein RvY_15523-2 [Ramazzottius varieornatus]